MEITKQSRLSRLWKPYYAGPLFKIRVGEDPATAKYLDIYPNDAGEADMPLDLLDQSFNGNHAYVVTVYNKIPLMWYAWAWVKIKRHFQTWIYRITKAFS